MESQQLLEITPSNSIKFEGTFKEIITKKLIIKNPLDKNVAFKIKTTTPKQYCVRPSVGFVAPQDSKEISIILQPMQYTITEKARHKFMIQSLIISEEEASNIDLVWKNAAPGSIMCTKLLSVLIQTPEIIKETEAPLEINSLSTPETATNFESIESPMASPLNGVSEFGDITLLGSSVSHNDNKDENLTEENNKLKDQVLTLKNMVFDLTYKMESLQTETTNNIELEKSIKEDVVVHKNESTGQLGLPLIIYQLLAFFLGLIIGKFFL